MTDSAVERASRRTVIRRVLISLISSRPGLLSMSVRWFVLILDFVLVLFFHLGVLLLIFLTRRRRCRRVWKTK